MYKKYKLHVNFSALLVVIAFLVLGCSSNNPLVGKWKPDSQRTLKELKLLEDPSKSALNCFESKICGTGLVEYSGKNYLTVIVNKNGEILSEKSATYQVLEITNDYVYIDQFNNGGKFKLYFESKDSMYIKNESGFNDYYLRVK